MSPLMPFSASGLRAQASTLQPLAAYRVVKSRPRPRAAPVISTVLMLLLLAAAKEPGALTLPVAFLDRLAFVVGLLARDQRDLDLGTAARIEINLQWHDGPAFALDGADQHVDLLAV